MKINKILYDKIQQDIEWIELQLESRNGSYNLWDNLRVRYEIIFPNLKDILNETEEKIAKLDEEFDFRPELKRVKNALLTQLFVNELEDVVNEDITNDAKILLDSNNLVTFDSKLDELIQESMIYIRKSDEKQKQIGLEKIWDAFERMKTFYSNNKKVSVIKILKEASQKSDNIYNLLEKESTELTKIGNEFQIRHFEYDKEPINSVITKEYLYFRILAFLSLCMNIINKDTV